MNKEFFTSPIELMESMRSFQLSRCLLTAMELNIFTQIDEKSLTAEEIAGKTGTLVKPLKRLLNVLCSLGLIILDNGKYTNNKLASDYLVSGKPSPFIGAGHLNNLWQTWSSLTDVLKTGKIIVESSVADRGKSWLKPFIKAMEGRGRQSALEIAPLIDFTNVKKMLDVGAGSGVFSTTFLSQNQTLHSTLFDLPDVIDITLEFVSTHQCFDRLDVLRGDYLKDSLGDGYDMVFLSAIIHSNSPEKNKLLIGKSYDSLNVNGKIVISDYIMNDEKTEPYEGALFGINMLVGTDDGDVYSFDEIKNWLVSSNFKNIRLFPVNNRTGLVTAEKI